MYGTVRIFTYIYHKNQLNVGKLVLNSHLDTFNNGYKSTSVLHLAFPSAKKTGMRTHLSHVFLWTKKTAGQSSHDSHARRQPQCRLTVATPNVSWELGLGEKLFLVFQSYLLRIGVQDPQIPPEVRPLGGPNTDLHKVFGGCWKTRVCEPNSSSLGLLITQDQFQRT